MRGTFRAFNEPEKFVAEMEERVAKIRFATNEADRDYVFYSVGAALTTWAKMEEGLILVLRLLTGVNAAQAGIILYSIVNFNAWLGIIDELLMQNSVQSNLKPKWNKISATLRALKDDRDRLAHNAVSADDPTAATRAAIIPSQFDVRQKSVKFAPLTVAEITAFSKQVKKVDDEITNLCELMMAQLESSQKKSVE
jgi:hypothetical protein